MRDAVIVSTARTGIGRAYKGAFNATAGATLGAFSLTPAVERAGVEGGEIEDLVWGCALPQGTQTPNIARLVALRAGLPVTVAGVSVDRQCGSGLMAIATAAKQIIVDGMDAAPSDHVYQLWYIDESGARAAGFLPVTDGVESWQVLEGDMHTGDVVGVTVEPTGGSKKPTTDPIMVIEPA